jgi:tetratricopeptide (TPR) repeat protein
MDSLAKGALIDFDARWDFSDPAATLELFRGILASSSSSDSPTAYRIELTTQVARCLGLMRRFDAGHATLDETDQTFPGALPGRWMIRVALERGRLFNSAGDVDAARKHFLHATTLDGFADGKTFVIDAMHMMAIVERETERQIEWANKALRLARESPAVLKWVPTILNNLGETYRRAGRFEEALNCFSGLIAACEAVGRPADRYARVDEAKMLRMLGRLNESRKKIVELYGELSAGREDDGFVFEELAENWLAIGEEEKAAEMFRSAYRLLQGETWIRQDEPARWSRLRLLAGGK